MKRKIFWNNKINIVNLLVIIASMALIGIAYIPYGIKGAETILIGLGCSGVAAGIIAILINAAQFEQDEKKKVMLKQLTLSPLFNEFNLLWERLLWLDDARDTHTFSEPVEYYLSLDFLTEASSWHIYYVMDWEEAKNKIERLKEKYSKEVIKETGRCSDISKMFLLLNRSSQNVKIEYEKLLNNKYFLTYNDILSNEDISNISIDMGYFLDFFGAPDMNYGLAIAYLFSAYKKIREIAGFNREEFYIAWKSNKPIVELYIDKKNDINNDDY